MKVKSRFCLLLAVSLLLSACAWDPANRSAVPVSDVQHITMGEFDPAAYYLNLASQSEEHIFNELELLLLDPELGYNSIKLGLIYAYKKSPVKNPHRAHRLLSKALASEQAYPQRGMLVALNDQLYDGLRWQHRYEAQQSNKQQQESLLKQQIAALRMQLDELTRIEQQLNERN
ncbi:DUF5320 domain-containing protein [Agarivorans gilvus]|jgi:hypothetical protein|uniref:Uncharacterized protein n=1 Tax=Agarivorans gilvus TaxID=680279 RepID=A0ABQ1HZX9_9ALTE|nr:DUF5320 domain-containing protein [Agarivorans gilvus]GGB03201.1 hypothetical protein GCM10007414_15680 [Agarivorans gilvus]